MARDRRKELENAIEDVDERVKEAGDDDLDEFGPDDSDDETAEDPGKFVPYTEQDRLEANAAFQLLLDAGFVTVGSYDLKATDDGRKIVTLSAFLPNTLDGRELDTSVDAPGEYGDLPDPNDG